jgi:OPT family oligopeptide transporter
MALSNLYVGLKTGWGLGVAITACILSFALYSTLARITPKFFGNNLTVLENNAMQSTASSAGYSTGTALVSAISALLMIQGHHVPAPALMGWVFLLAVMGTVIAIPLKRQMINIEQLRFPSGVAAAETLRSLYASGESAAKKAKTLFGAMGLGALVAWLRDAHAAAATGILAWLTKLSVIPATIPVPGLLIRGIPAARYTIAFEGSFILMAAGALIGLRTTATMAVASLLNYGVLAPWAKEQGAIKDLGFRGIVSWSLWIGASIMVSSGLLSFAFQWRTVSRAFKDLAKVFRPTNEGEKDPLAAVEVPGSWFLIGVGVTTVGIVALGAGAFGIHPALGVLAVLLSFVLAIVACRATGETDVTPIGALGKVTQLTYGVLAPSNVVTNITTASITASVASSSADLLTDLKSGYLLGANPRKQFLAQLAGTVVGTLVAVPAFYKLVPGPEALGTDRFPAPSAQVWKGVAELLSNGVESLHPTARAGMLVGLAVGIVITLLEQAFPKYKPYMPSAMGMGLAFVIPAFNSISMLIGSLIAVGFAKVRPQLAEEYTTPVAAGLIAGESLLGVAVALMAAAGWLQ